MNSSIKKSLLPVALFVLIAIFAFYLLFRNRMSHCAELVIAGKKNIPITKQFEELYPQSLHFISYCDNPAHQPIWNSKVGVYGRYVLSMSFRVNIVGDNIKAAESPSFILTEIEQVQSGAAGTLTITNGTVHIEFGIDEWKRLFDNKGRIESIWRQIRTDRPVKGFDTGWQRS